MNEEVWEDTCNTAWTWLKWMLMSTYPYNRRSWKERKIIHNNVVQVTGNCFMKNDRLHVPFPQHLEWEDCEKLLHFNIKVKIHITIICGQGCSKKLKHTVVLVNWCGVSPYLFVYTSQWITDNAHNPLAGNVMIPLLWLLSTNNLSYESITVFR